MNEQMMNPSDTNTWLPLDGLAPGFDANKAKHSTRLADRTIALAESGNHYRFSENSLEWSMDDRSGSADYEAFLVDDDLFFIQFHDEKDPNRASSLILDLRDGRALRIESLIRPAGEAQTAVGHTFQPDTIVGSTIAGSEMRPSSALIGRRVQWVYSELHAYEHIYLSPQWYTWQCLSGPERGLADTDVNTVYQVRPGIYIFSWREKVIPCGSVTIADHRDITSLRAHGVLFGLDESGTKQMHFTFGAYGRLLSNTVHPVEFDPAL